MTADERSELAALDLPPSEVNFALVILRMLDQVKNDPQQMRALVYDLARAKLWEQFRREDARNVKPTVEALEAAIREVERFAKLEDAGKVSLSALSSQAVSADRALRQLADGADAAPSAMAAAGGGDAIFPASENWDDATAARRGFGVRSEVVQPRFKPVLWSPALLRLAAAFAVLFAAAAGVMLYRTRMVAPSIQSAPAPAQTAGPVATPPVVPNTAAPAPTIAASAPSPGRESAPPEPPQKEPYPVPTSYGVYAVAEDRLYLLNPVPIVVPDLRVAMSSPIANMQNTMLPTGRLAFIIYKPDMRAMPERLDVRVLARIARSTMFGEGGKPQKKSGDFGWIIRNVATPYRVGPLPRHVDMQLVRHQSETFALSPGSYVLTLNGQGYEFTVGGTVTDPNQCVERLEAQNGVFFSPCPTN